MSKNSYQQHRTEDRRLVILRLLKETPGYSTNSSILQEALNGVGHRVSRDQIHTDLAWLDEQGLVEAEALASVHVATLTDRGYDVADGAATVPGVKKPRPGRTG